MDIQYTLTAFKNMENPPKSPKISIAKQIMLKARPAVRLHHDNKRVSNEAQWYGARVCMCASDAVHIVMQKK